jgi:hypothetical protein
MSKIKDRTGEVNINSSKKKIWVKEYLSSQNCTIEFENGYIIKNVSYDRFKRGSIVNPTFPSVFNLGYIGEGVHKSYKNLAYSKWYSMMERSYSLKYQRTQPTHKGVSVYKDWHNYQNFVRWFNDEHIKNWHLDKDILVKENKIYSPENCCFVPQEINNLFTSRVTKRGDYPLGVNRDRDYNSYRSTFTQNGRQTYLGSFKNPEDAFFAYKKAKEVHIKEVAEKWKGQIKDNVYQALLNYKIEITD